MDLRGTRDHDTLPEVHQAWRRAPAHQGSSKAPQTLRGLGAPWPPCVLAPGTKLTGALPHPLTETGNKSSMLTFQKRKKDALTVDEGRIGPHPGRDGQGLVLVQSHQHIVPKHFFF